MELSMHGLMISGFCVLLWVAGCASMPAASTGAAPVSAQIGAPRSLGPPPVAATAATAAPSQSTQPAPSSKKPSAGKKMKSSTTHPAAKKADLPVPAPQSPDVPPTAQVKPAAPSPPTLDLAALEQRLRDTHAIGVFTKLSLKNQVDDLLSEFRTLYHGSNRHPTAQLRQRYDLLLLKVLSLLQDSDPPLAAAISASREAIWGILADPDKFAKI